MRGVETKELFRKFTLHSKQRAIIYIALLMNKATYSILTTHRVHQHASHITYHTNIQVNV